MSEFLNFVSTRKVALSEAEVEAAIKCLYRFTEAFNACDAAGMDAELHFPHLLCAGSESITWEAPGQHPENFFQQLKSMGWACTKYDSIKPVLAARDKVHFVVKYRRLQNSGETLSEHENLWIVVNRQEKWGILVRSY